MLANLGIKPEDRDSILQKGEVRQSRRIAQLKIREEAERGKTEDILKIHTKSKSKKDKTFKHVESTDKHVKKKYESASDCVVERIDNQKKKRRKKKLKDPKKIFDESHPWRSSSDESTDVHEEEEEYAVEYSEPEEEPLQFKSDHEFSPESDVEDGDYKPTKRARTARKESDAEAKTDDCPCKKCGKSDNPEWILLCDKCDSGWHCECVRPPIFVIPEGDWFCPPCSHIKLVIELQEKLIDYEKKLAKKELEDRRKERLAYVGISLNNVLKNESKKKSREESSEFHSESESDSELSSGSDDSDEPIYQLRQRRQARTYRFNDYDDLINSAIQDEMEAAKGAGNQGRGKDIANIVNAKEVQVENEDAPEARPPVVPKVNEDRDLLPADEEDIGQKKFLGRKKSRKLNSLEDDSEDDAYDDEDFKGSGSASEEDEEDELSGSDDSQRDTGPVRRSTRIRTARYDADFINDSSSDDEAIRKRKKKAKWADSESEDSEGWGRRKQSKTNRHSSGSKKKKTKKKKTKRFDDSDLESYQKKKKPKIIYGGLTSDEEDLGPRTRGRKINYLVDIDSESEEDKNKTLAKKSDSDDDFVANDDEEYDKNSEDEVDDGQEENGSSDSNLPTKKVPKLKMKVRRIIESDDEDSIQYEDSESKDVAKSEAIEKKTERKESKKSKSRRESQSDLNTSEESTKNLDDMDEAEIEKMMEDEEYANRQLQLVAIQIEKNRKKEEQAKKKRKSIEALEKPKSPIKIHDMTKKEMKASLPEKLSSISNPTLLQMPDPQVDSKTPVQVPQLTSNPEVSIFPIRRNSIPSQAKPEEVEIEIKKQPTQITNKLQQSIRNKLAKDRTNPPKPNVDIIFNQESVVGSVQPHLVNSGDSEDLLEPPSSTLPIFSQLAPTGSVREPVLKKQSRTKKSIRDALANMEMVRNQGQNQAVPQPCLSKEQHAVSTSGRNQGRKPAAPQANPPNKSRKQEVPQAYLSNQAQKQPIPIIISNEQLHTVSTLENKIEIAAPPQPFSESHPSPSVITRMLQSEPMIPRPNVNPKAVPSSQPNPSRSSSPPASISYSNVNSRQISVSKSDSSPSATLSPVTNTYPVGTIRPKQFARLTESESDELVTPKPKVQSLPPISLPSSIRITPVRTTSGPRTKQTPYRNIDAIKSSMGSYQRSSPQAPPTVNPHVMPSHMYHPPRNLDHQPPGAVPVSSAPPSGASVTMTPGISNLPDRISSSSAVQAVSNPASKAGHTPPSPTSQPAPSQYPRQAASRLPPNVPPRHVPQTPQLGAQHMMHSRPMQSYPPPPPPQQNYHYGYTVPVPLPVPPSDEVVPPPTYQHPTYSEPYVTDDCRAINPSDGGSSRAYEEESGGEFGGLVSYFSSQREDDLDS